MNIIPSINPVVPSDWSQINTEDICFFQEGPGIRSYEYSTEGCPIINVRCVKDGYIDLSDCEYVSWELINTKWRHFLVDIGDILLTTSGTIGRVAIINANDIPLLMNTSVVRFRSLNENILSNGYLQYYLKSEIFYNQLYSQHTGAVIKNVGPSHIKNTKVFFPSLPEQRAIARVLAIAQKAISTAQSRIDVLRNLKRSLMKHLFSYGPVPPAKAHTVPCKQTEIGEIPAHWSIKHLIDIATLQRGKDLPIDQMIDDGIPVIGSNGIIGYHNVAICKGPGVITGRSGSIGKFTYVEVDYWPHNTCLYVKDFHGNNPKFVFFWLHMLDFSSYASGVSVPTLNRNTVHTALIPLPPLAEQIKIANILSIIDSSIATTEKVCDAREQLFKSLLHNLMSGKLRTQPTEADNG